MLAALITPTSRSSCLIAVRIEGSRFFCVRPRSDDQNRRGPRAIGAQGLEDSEYVKRFAGVQPVTVPRVPDDSDAQSRARLPVSRANPTAAASRLRPALATYDAPSFTHRQLRVANRRNLGAENSRPLQIGSTPACEKILAPPVCS